MEANPRCTTNAPERVVQFLDEAGLIAKDRRILDLNSADLSDVNLTLANLSNANLARPTS
jgi:uncharacterized protein YjbI with pentapeptide repeats